MFSFISELVRSSELLLFGQHQSLLKRRHLHGDGGVEHSGLLHGGPEAFVACRGQSYLDGETTEWGFSQGLESTKVLALTLQKGNIFHLGDPWVQTLHSTKHDFEKTTFRCKASNPTSSTDEICVTSSKAVENS